MPKFICNKCGQIISHTETDTEFFRRRGNICLMCYRIFCDRRYPVNVKGAKTVFAPVTNFKLGDQIISEVVRRMYLKDNPDEQVIFTEMPIETEEIMSMGARKIFWAAETNFIRVPQEGVYKFITGVEADGWAERGEYPQWTGFNSVTGLPEQYAVVSARNINNGHDKNMSPEEFKTIVNLITGEYKLPALLVGNDYPFAGYELPESVLDKRMKLSLDEIAFVCQQAKLFVGKDCGIVHLAAAAGCKNMVSYGYVGQQWFPKAPRERWTAFLRKDSHLSNVVEAIRRRMAIENGHCRYCGAVA